MSNNSRIEAMVNLKSFAKTGLLWVCLLFLALSLPLAAVEEDLAPEHATGQQHNQSVQADKALVVTAHPLATRAGYEVLQNGGSAADAAVAIQAMLTLVEPQSSGIGGGAFMLYWDQQAGRLHAYDGRETAPASADAKLFYRDDKPMSWPDALVGGRSVGTPGVLKLLEMAQTHHGKLPWAALFRAAIDQSRAGFSVGPRLHQLIASGINPGLDRYPQARDYFFTPAGEPLPVGYLRQNPRLADSLEQIAESGTDAFYQGPLAAAMVDRIRQVSDNPGRLSLEDLASYQAVEREPLCLPYQRFRVCGFPPPTSGGVTVLQILKLLEGFDLSQPDPLSPRFNHLFTQASRLAFADRGRYLADPDFVDVPVAGLLDPTYLQQRAALIHAQQDSGQAQPGVPENSELSRADDQSPELPSTSHFVVVDQWGNAVSVTSSIEMAFGSTLMAGGFLLNNQLTDFSFVPEQDGRAIANRVEAGKRPRSSMAPFMVFDEQGRLYAAIGSPGGSRIINYVARSLLLMLNSDLPLQEVVNQPHVSNRNGQTELEAGTTAEQLAKPLAEMGHQIKIRDLNSGLHGFRRLPQGGWESAVDNRREGQALGE
ncbi:gamma-glutamyltransferase [Neptuniibacter halophilus]|uniref:gamma-glutamyltransferase n=1 Tax=Neptuniibacter halophilus TaxID=651666 RepID=UPI0025722CE3|nr:gamma-glutamyltransferase [Neptuniibacter halophilus]